MSDKPFSFMISHNGWFPSRYDRHVARRLSDMIGHFADLDAYQAALEQRDLVIYEVYEIQRPARSGELNHGITIIHPGKIGDEYFMTKGHFHSVLDTAEIYYCLHGEGLMVMETPEENWAVEPFEPGGVLYVPPRWAHRMVNTHPEEDLVALFIYPGNSGHDYGSIERKGFRKMVVDQGGRPQIRDNPRRTSANTA